MKTQLSGEVDNAGKRWKGRKEEKNQQTGTESTPWEELRLITVRNRRLCYPLDSTVAIKFKMLLDNKQARYKRKILHKRGRLLISIVVLEESLFPRLNPSQAELRRRFVSSQQKPSWLESQRGLLLCSDAPAWKYLSGNIHLEDPTLVFPCHQEVLQVSSWS
ncbi:hypothetical protein L345_11885, partial [Ophiophagus hannah]